MATTAFFLILSDVVGTQYERDGRASWGFIKFYVYLAYPKTRNFSCVTTLKLSET